MTRSLSLFKFLILIKNDLCKKVSILSRIRLIDVLQNADVNNNEGNNGEVCAVNSRNFNRMTS